MTMSASAHTKEMCESHNHHHEQRSSAPAHRNHVAVGGWHVMLAQLVVALRSCLPPDELAVFDRVHACAHRKELPVGKFLVFALDMIRRNAPHLEGGFRHVFMLRTASRRRNMQSGRVAAPCTRARSNDQDSPGTEDEDAVDQALKKFSGMCVGESKLAERKRQCDEPMEDGRYRTKAHFVHIRHSVHDVC
eukprot:CAMPEP_0196720984 /NCGR_PEP_ID=MMETSP1091-20130531/3661_1 /TAXON_ID=302021 /ORGANISM="Rhodomonas sp., Strain CCMP768" /LENGTH=190 /DNA_ID=CAMNT_0042062345 /DNA_START=22 /DNA_END=594 /DNA_ORIENTATION=-